MNAEVDTAALASGDALLVVDVQVDFCPDGKLAIDSGDRVVPVLNRWIAAARDKNLPVYASRCWHPAGHVSFTESGGEWPEHCVQDTPGAAFHPDLELPADAVVVSKGVRLDKDQYSAFDLTGLAGHMADLGVRRVWVGGLAQDVCVRASVLDAREAGLEAWLIPGATYPVTADGGLQALADMREAGAKLPETADRG